jgi:hypothetical protein
MKLEDLRKQLTWFACALAMAAGARPVSAASAPLPASETLTIPRVSRAPSLEEFLTGTPREAETMVTGFRQFQPGDGAPVSQETWAYLSYDDKNLYVVFVCKDDPAKIRAHLTKREDFFVTDSTRGSSIGDDFVSVNIDTFLDRRRAYVFISNPLGIQRDGIYGVGRGTDITFDAVWESEGRLTADGYVVRFAIPFKSLRFQDAPTQKWGIALGRIIPRTNEITFWPYITRRVEGLVQQCATLEGIEGIPLGRNIQLIPHSELTSGRFLDDRATVPHGFQSGREAAFGLDGKFVFREAITLDVAVNPDFSQVETDEPQPTANQRFEVFYPERRPFFLENAVLFQSHDVHGGLNLVDPLRSNLFFSRRVADPQVGARLTGRAGAWTFGALATDDRRPGAIRAFGDSTFGDRAAVGVARVQREFGKQSSVGILATSRDFGPSASRVVSIDGRIKLSPKWVLNGQGIRTFTTTLDGARRSGPGYLLELYRTDKRWTYTARYQDRSPDFATELGYIDRVDVRQVGQHLNWRSGARKGSAMETVASFDGRLNWDRQGTLQDASGAISVGAILPRQTVVRLVASQARERYQGLDFDRRRLGATFTTQWLSWLAASGTHFWDAPINYHPAGGRAPFLTTGREERLTVILKPSTRFRLEQTYLYDGARARARGTTDGVPPRGRIFGDHVFRTRVHYQFNRELSVRGIFDYRSLGADTSLIELQPEKRLAPDVLLTYLLNPGTALYVGFSDRYENLRLGPDGEVPIRTSSARTSTSRQFFVKLSYLLRF